MPEWPLTDKEVMNKYEIISFGYKYGMPPRANFLFDVRRMPNPFYEPTLQLKDGRDKEVQKYVFGSEKGAASFSAIANCLRDMIPGTRGLGKDAAIRIAVGCTGGHHRSVAVAERLGEVMDLILTARIGDIEVTHRDLEKS